MAVLTAPKQNHYKPLYFTCKTLSGSEQYVWVLIIATGIYFTISALHQKT